MKRGGWSGGGTTGAQWLRPLPRPPLPMPDALPAACGRRLVSDASATAAARRPDRPLGCKRDSAERGPSRRDARFVKVAHASAKSRLSSRLTPARGTRPIRCRRRVLREGRWESRFKYPFGSRALKALRERRRGNGARVPEVLSPPSVRRPLCTSS